MYRVELHDKAYDAEHYYEPIEYCAVTDYTLVEGGFLMLEEGDSVSIVNLSKYYSAHIINQGDPD